jgi:hypothetical protein
LQSNRLPFIPTRGSGPPQATVGPYAHPMCRTYVCSATTWPYSCPLCGTYSRTSVRVKNQITSGGGYVHSSGRLVTRLIAYHISRHVASTFKRLTTTTTHCDLIKFALTQTGFLLRSWIINHNPVRHPYSGCRNVNIATPIKLPNDRKSLDFYRSY